MVAREGMVGAMISVPTCARRFVVTDAALNIASDTDRKRDICQNAIGFARAGAARMEHIDSPVAGASDVLLAPNLEAGNSVFKNIGFMADSQSAGLVVRAPVPVILSSRADTANARAFPAAAAVLFADAITRDPTILQPEVAE